MAIAEQIRPVSKTAQVKKTVPADLVTITPQIAEEMLGKNVRNRRISRHTVEAYARDMATGNWKFTGEAIKFAKDGTLQDGQHRLLACVKSGRPFTTLIVFDLSDDAQDVMDTGRVRTVADALGIKGHAFAARISTACRWLHIVKNGYSQTRVTHAEQFSMLERHPGLNDSAHIVQNVYGISQGLLTCIHYIGAKLLDNSPFADEFVTIFITGNSYDGCAAHAWRERLIRMKAAKTPITRAYMYNGSVHAWNLFSASKEVKHIRIPESVAFEGLNLDLI
jgi:hypothetical protein